MKYRTKFPTKTKTASYIHPSYSGITIPAGSPCVPAVNHPGGFYIDSFEGMDETWKSHLETYGILVHADRVEEIHEN